jgi:hypothetical protein
MPHYTEKTGGLLPPPDTGSKPSWETFSRPTSEHKVSRGIAIATPGINQHSPWTDWPPALQKKKKNLNHKQGTEKEHAAEGAGCYKQPGKGLRGKELISEGIFSKQRLERQKGWHQTGDKLLPEIGQVVVHKAHFLSQWATSKVKWCCKIEKQSANHHNMLTAGSQLTDLWPCPRERGQGKETSPQ